MKKTKKELKKNIKSLKEGNKKLRQLVELYQIDAKDTNDLLCLAEFDKELSSVINEKNFELELKNKKLKEELSVIKLKEKLDTIPTRKYYSTKNFGHFLFGLFLGACVIGMLTLIILSC